jgi:hypothetical protein
MNPTLKGWLIGALNAVLSGAAATVGSFAAGVTFKQGAIIVGTAAVTSFAKWMLQHPLPGTPTS